MTHCTHTDSHTLQAHYKTKHTHCTHTDSHMHTHSFTYAYMYQQSIDFYYVFSAYVWYLNLFASIKNGKM